MICTEHQPSRQKKYRFDKENPFQMRSVRVLVSVLLCACLRVLIVSVCISLLVFLFVFMFSSCSGLISCPCSYPCLLSSCLHFYPCLPLFSNPRLWFRLPSCLYSRAWLYAELCTWHVTCWILVRDFVSLLVCILARVYVLVRVRYPWPLHVLGRVHIRGFASFREENGIDAGSVAWSFRSRGCNWWYRWRKGYACFEKMDWVRRTAWGISWPQAISILRAWSGWCSQRAKTAVPQSCS